MGYNRAKAAFGEGLLERLLEGSRSCAPEQDGYARMLVLKGEGASKAEGRAGGRAAVAAEEERREGVGQDWPASGRSWGWPASRM